MTEIETIREGVHRVVVPFAGADLISATNCFVIVDAESGVHLVDPGSPQEVSDAALRAGLAGLGLSIDDVRSVTATHAHHDHIGWASRAPGDVAIGVGRRERATLRHPFSVAVTEEVLDRWGVPDEHRAELAPPPAAASNPTEPTLLLDDGDLLDVPGHTVRVIATPGHTAGSISLAVGGDLVLTGDSVLPGLNPGLGMGGFDDGDDVIGLALDSLDRLAARGAVDVGPGHGDVFPDLAARAGVLADRHRARAAEIAAIAGTNSIWETATRVRWTGGWEGVRGYLRVSALWQTELHLRRLTG